MEKFGLSKMFEGNLASIMDDVFDTFDEKITSYFPDYAWLKPDYKLKENNGKYEVTVKYNEGRDDIHIETNKDERSLTISVYEDWNKTGAITACTYYGKNIITVPDDCDLDSIQKTVNKEKNEMVISFNKVQSKEETESKNKNHTEDKEDYKTAYNRLLSVNEQYNKKIERLEYANNALRKENEELAKKLNNIKNLFN